MVGSVVSPLLPAVGDTIDLEHAGAVKVESIALSYQMDDADSDGEVDG